MGNAKDKRNSVSCLMKCLLVLGLVVGSMSSVHAELLSGTISGKEVCRVPGSGGLGERGGGRTDVAINIDASAFPSVIATATSFDTGQVFTMAGFALEKSKKGGFFQITGTDVGGNELAMNGTYKAKNGFITQMKGVFQNQNELFDGCFATGKFKAAS
jgi:hypothetical protein